MGDAIARAAGILLDSDYATALTGAGISVESGIRPFRGPKGLWTEKGEPSMDRYQRLLEDPQSYWENRLKQIEGGFLSSILEAEPNPGHYALAEMEDMSIIRSIVTQNIDGLHGAAGSRNVLRIHGTVHKLRCMSCETRYDFDDFDYSVLP
ncbi:MAG: SIR2 family NAD-dependent protein deacylase, partial [Candidatus Bathyarchaeia archaeon]